MTKISSAVALASQSSRLMFSALRDFGNGSILHEMSQMTFK